MLIQQSFVFRLRHGAVEYIALHIITFEFFQVLHLFRNFNSFCDRTDIKLMHQLNNTPYEIQVSGMIIAFQKEVAVYFQNVNRELLKQAQGGIALSEIINRAGEAIRLQAFYDRKEKAGIVKYDGFRKFDFKELRGNMIFIPYFHIAFDEIGIIKLQPGNIDGNRKGGFLFIKHMAEQRQTSSKTY